MVGQFHRVTCQFADSVASVLDKHIDIECMLVRSGVCIQGAVASVAATEVKHCRSAV